MISDLPVSVSLQFIWMYLTQLDLAVLAFGFLAGLLALALAVELRAGLDKKLALKRYLYLKGGVVVCITASIAYGSVFVSLAMPRAQTSEYSVSALVLAFLLTGLGVLAWRWSLNHTKSPLAFKLVYAVGGGLLLTFGHLSLFVGSQFLHVASIDWLMFGEVVSLGAVGLWGLSQFEYRLQRNDPMSVRSRLTYVMMLNSLSLLMVLALIGMVSFHDSRVDYSPFWLVLSYHGFAGLVDLLALSLIISLLCKMYGSVAEKLSGLEHQNSSLAAMTEHQQQLVEQQQSQLNATQARLRTLEQSVADGHYEGLISADSLIAAVLSVEEGVFEWDLERQTLKLSNAWNNLLGLSSTKASEERIRMLLSGVLREDWQAGQQQLKLLLGGKVEQIKGQVRYTNPYGNLLKVEVRMVAVRNPYGLPTRLVGMLTDRTQEFDLERAIRRELDEESMLSRLKSDFVTYLSHEIRTPMTVIASANALLDADIRLNRLNIDRAIEFSDQVTRAVRSLRALVDETLNFISSEPDRQLDLREIPLDFVGLLRSTVEIESRRRQLEPDETLRLNISEGMPDFLTMPEAVMTQALRHFVAYILNETVGQCLCVSMSSGLVHVEAAFMGRPDWLPADDQSTLLETDLMDSAVALEDEQLPFGLLLTKRVIRNVRGTLTLNKKMKMGRDFYTLGLNIPVSRETACLTS